MIRDPEYAAALKVVKTHQRARRKESKADRLARAREHLKAVTEGQRKPRERDTGFLAYLRRQPCRVGPEGCVGPVQAAHVRFGDARHGRVNPGMQKKPDDRWCVSLCAGHHAEQHANNERAWWESHGMDGSTVAISQYADYQGLNPPLHREERG